MPPASELLCQTCIAQLGITLLAYVAAIRQVDDEGLCVRCRNPMSEPESNLPGKRS